MNYLTLAVSLTTLDDFLQAVVGTVEGSLDRCLVAVVVIKGSGRVGGEGDAEGSDIFFFTLAAGDFVRFTAIGLQEFQSLQQRAEAGLYAPKFIPLSGGANS